MSISLVKQTYMIVGIPSAMLHRISAIEVQTGDSIDPVGKSGLLQTHYAVAQRRRDNLVGINREDKPMARKRSGILPLGTEAVKRTLYHLAPGLTTYIHRSVGGKRIDHDDFVGNIAQRVQTSAYALLFIESQNGGGDFFH